MGDMSIKKPRQSWVAHEVMLRTLMQKLFSRGYDVLLLY
jgi:hypothetical protein